MQPQPVRVSQRQQFPDAGGPYDLSQKVASTIWVVFVILAAIGQSTSNPLLTGAGFLIPPILFQLLWRDGEPPILLFAASFQWLQAFSPVLSADFSRISLSDRIGGPELDQAAWLTLISVIVLALGMKAATRSMPRITTKIFSLQAKQLSPTRLAIAYVLCSFLSTAVLLLAARIPSLRAAFASVAGIRWVPITMIIWAGLTYERFSKLLGVVVILELIIGLTGFFAGFKSILFLLIVVTAGTRTGGRLPIGRILLVAALLLSISTYWQAIKGEYRRFLNQGTKKQVVKAPLIARLRYIVDKARVTTLAELQNGLLTGISRLGYLDYFAYSIRSVPKRIPYQDGALWSGAIMHIATPRFLFPDKPVISDSSRTSYFTGLALAGDAQGTSISIGYIGESYIDFGSIWMFAPIFALGCCYGGVYRWFSGFKGLELFGVSVALSFLITVALLIESSNIKLTGGIGIGFLFYGAVSIFFGKTLWLMICERVTIKPPQ